MTTPEPTTPHASGPPAENPRTAAQGRGLTIVLPALNEELAIGSTIERCLAVRNEIREKTGISEVQIVVVSDGSTDRTTEIAQSYEGVDVLVFQENRGYGAAIKAGWERGGGDLLGFLDADGTCDPKYFIPMCRGILEEGQDVVIGNRMGRDSRMPPIRRVGNLLFALTLGLLSKKSVHDTASGMRVVRREALSRLLPLPDGLHFTPAMSATALMDGEVKLAEVDMRYEERVGESKLNVLRDGLRFLKVILSAAAYIQVSRLTVPLMAILGVATVLLLFGPATFYVTHGRLEEWMIYRITFAGMLGTIVVTLLCATIVVEHAVALTLMRYARFHRQTRGLWRYENLKLLAGVGIALWIAGALLNLGGLVELISSGHVSLHWSRVIAGAFVTINLAQLLGALCAVKIVRALHQRQPFLHDTGRPDKDAP